MPEAAVGRAWRRLHRTDPAGAAVRVERRPASTMWVLLEGKLTGSGAARFVADLRVALARRKDRVVLDLARLAELEREAVAELVAGLAAHRDRIRVILPRVGDF